MAHIPVLLQETIDGLALKKGGIYVDCTTNRGGHSIEIAKAIGEKGVLICIDLDQEALDEAKIQLSALKNSPSIHFVHSNFIVIDCEFYFFKNSTSAFSDAFISFFITYEAKIFPIVLSSHPGTTIGKFFSAAATIHESAGSIS